jgi:hypothetical protein
MRLENASSAPVKIATNAKRLVRLLVFDFPKLLGAGAIARALQSKSQRSGKPLFVGTAGRRHPGLATSVYRRELIKHMKQRSANDTLNAG